jgi:hypothetical protein
MAEKEWIGVQFNFDQKSGLKDWIKKYESIGVKSDEEHITVEFGNNELKRLGSEKSKKVEILKIAIGKFLKDSDYTNIYTYLNADDLKGQKSELLKGEFSSPIRVTEFQDSKSILSNYESALNSGKVKKILAKDRLMIAMDEIFNFIVDRGFETDQELITKAQPLIGATQNPALSSLHTCNSPHSALTLLGRRANVGGPFNFLFLE